MHNLVNASHKFCQCTSEKMKHAFRNKQQTTVTPKLILSLRRKRKSSAFLYFSKNIPLLRAEIDACGPSPSPDPVHNGSFGAQGCPFYSIAAFYPLDKICVTMKTITHNGKFGTNLKMMKWSPFLTVLEQSESDQSDWTFVENRDLSKTKRSSSSTYWGLIYITDQHSAERQRWKAAYFMFSF